MSNVLASETFGFRDIAPGDAPACARLSRAVGWPHRPEDWEMAIDLGHGVVSAHEGEMVASGLCWPYGDSHATMGLIIVAPAHQGAGLGKRLMQHLFDRMQGRSVMLNATAAGTPLYVKYGFSPCGSVTQYNGDAAMVAAPASQDGGLFRIGSTSDLPDLERLDLAASGLPRRPALTYLLACGQCVVLERAGKVAGFSFIRPFGRGEIVGPVVAAGENDARDLIAYWLHGRQGRFVRVDMSGDAGLGGWLERCGLKSAGSVTTMVRGELPVTSGPQRRYALINQAFG